MQLPLIQQALISVGYEKEAKAFLLDEMVATNICPSS
jgi:hypothetical protein